MLLSTNTMPIGLSCWDIFTPGCGFLDWLKKTGCSLKIGCKMDCLTNVPFSCELLSLPDIFVLWMSIWIRCTEEERYA